LPGNGGGEYVELEDKTCEETLEKKMDGRILFLLHTTIFVLAKDHYGIWLQFAMDGN